MVPAALAGGPRWVAGTSYFDPAAKGQPLHWKNGTVFYFTDLGNLSSQISQSQANSMIATAAAVWSAVPTAAVQITSGGSLNEDVSGANVKASTMPADVQSAAAATPVGIVYDADGTVINTLFGQGASDPSDCRDNGVMTVVDNLATDGTIVHALMLVNGLCAASAGQIEVLQYQMIRGFGRVLGLDWSQANESMFADGSTTSDGLAGWPLMHPIERLCGPENGPDGGPCMPNDNQLRPDDIAALNRLYPVTAENVSSGKQITAQVTVSIQGSIYFKTGQGMQGVNVVARPLIPGTNTPDPRYTVSAVSGAYFQGDAGNPVNGPRGTKSFGSDDPALEGWFDLSGIPLPPGETEADYQISFEAIDPLDSAEFSVGAYVPGQVTPSGTMPVFILRGLHAGSTATQNATIADSASDTHTNDGTETSPAAVAAAGEWLGRLTGYGHAGFYKLWIRANREFSVEASALDENGLGTDDKMRPVLGVWNGTDAPGTQPVAATTQPFNGKPVGLTTLTSVTIAASEVRLGVADDRGDGRPDYAYRGRVLYADTVSPARLPAAGGPIVIRGMGFREDSTVTVNGLPAAVTGASPTEITAIAPASGGKTGVVLLVISDPETQGVTAIEDGLSYDARNDDEIGIVSAPQGTVAMNVPVPFTIRAIGIDGKTPAAGITITFTVTEGAASLACGQSSCKAITGGDGTATLTVTPTSAALAQVTAALTDGAGVLAEFTGGAAPTISALTPSLYIAIGAKAQWTPQVLVLNNGSPTPGQIIAWIAGAGAGISPFASAGITAANGTAQTQITAGPLAAGATVPLYACLPGNTVCATLNVVSVHPETALLTALNGVGQTIAASQTPIPVTLRITDAIGHPMAGGVVTFYETLKQWTPACPAHGRCPPAATLGTDAVQAISGADGLVTLVPMTGHGQPTRLEVMAVTGEQATISFEIEQHP